MLARCTSSLDLHMLIVPYWYLFRTLLVPKVALGKNRRNNSGQLAMHATLCSNLFQAYYKSCVCVFVVVVVFVF